MEKLNFSKAHKRYYTAKKKPEIREFGKIPYLSIVGRGEPGGQDFTSAVEALYPLAFGVKKVYKAKEMDFGVPKLEGLWWTDGNDPAQEVPRSEWNWKLLIRMPDYVDEEVIPRVKEEVKKKKGVPLVDKVHLEQIHEGKCVQALHVGPYSTEPQTIQSMLTFMEEHEWEMNGLHHEIYLSDPRRVAPEKLKTILRFPVKPKQKSR